MPRIFPQLSLVESANKEEVTGCWCEFDTDPLLSTKRSASRLGSRFFYFLDGTNAGYIGLLNPSKLSYKVHTFASLG